MSIIGNIRKFPGLDKATLSLDNEFIDSTGLWISERKELLKVETHGCFGHSHSLNDPVLTDLHHDHVLHFTQDFHCNHF